MTISTGMLAFTGTTVTKHALIDSLTAHWLADRIVQGRYWRDGRGCAVGCSLVDFGARTDDHSAYETLFGIPRVLARLEDGIFERLPAEAARDWPLRFARAVREGADLSLVWPRFAVWMLVDKEHGVVQFANQNGRLAIEAVAALYQRLIAGETPERDEFQAAAAAAAAAYAADAAYAATTAAYAADAATTAAYAADAADAATTAAYAADAATTAAYAADAADAADAFRARLGVRGEIALLQADKLVELLEAA